MRDRLVARLQDVLAPLGIHPTVTELGPDTDLSLLPERLAAEIRDGQPVFVCGLETLMPSADPWEALAALNHRRESYHMVNAPLVIWLPEYALNEIATRAGDFWAWRSGVYCFDSDQILSTQTLEAGTAATGAELADFPVEEKRRRIRLLRSLSEDYRGDHPDVRAVRGEVLLQLSLLHFTLGEIEQGIAYSHEVEQIAQELPSPALQAAALGNLGFAYSNVGRTGDALRSLEHARRLWATLGDRAREGATLNHLGNAFRANGDYAGARRAYEAAQVIANALDDRSAVGEVLGSLGGLELRAGSPEKAVQYLEEALLIAREAHDKSGEAVRLSNLAVALLALEQWERVLQIGAEALEVARELGSRRVELNTLGNLGSAYLALGDTAEARNHYESALKVARSVGDRFHEAEVLGNLGNCCLAGNDFPTAFAFYYRAMAIARELNMTGLEAGILWNLAQVFDYEGNQNAARAAASRMVRLREQGLDGSGPRLPEAPATPIALDRMVLDANGHDTEILERALLATPASA
jgi:tetratricopeptide (TPR) repeat protein